MRCPYAPAFANRDLLRQGVKANVPFFDRKPASETPWTKDLWIHDVHTNQHFTLKISPLKPSDLEGSVSTYSAIYRSKRVKSDQFHRFTYEDLLARDKVSLDIFWLKDDSLDDLDNLPYPATLAAEILGDLEAAPAEFSVLAESLADLDVVDEG
jgi:type I restriction enzyme M protein